LHTKYFKFTLIATIFLLAQLPLVAEAEGAIGGVSSITATSYSCSKLGGLPVVLITYLYPSISPLTAIVYGVVRNSIGQTVYYTTATLQFQAPSSESAYLAIPGLARGNYSISAFAITTSDVAISTTSTLSCPI
jgi:hypothetical protein